MDAKTLVLIAISVLWLLCLVVCFLKGKYGMAIVGLIAAVAQEVGLPPIGGYYILNLIYPALAIAAHWGSAPSASEILLRKLVLPAQSS